MRKIVGPLVAISLVVAVARAQDKPAVSAEAATANALIANERALYSAAANADKTAFMSLALADGVWATKQGWIPMDAFVEALSRLKLTKWDIVNPRVTWLSADSAIVVYAWTGMGTFHDQPLAPTTLASTVWTKRDGKWRAAHHQETELAK